MMDKIKGYFKKLFKILKKPEMAILPANIAFHLILAIIPLVTVIVLIASSFSISVDLVTNFIREIMPAQVSTAIIELISGKGFDTNVGVFNIMAFVLASNGMYALIRTANALYKVKDSDWIKDRLNSFVLLFIIIILFVFLIIVPVFGDNIMLLISKTKILENHIDTFRTIFNIIKWPITLLIVYFNIKLIYTISPSKSIRSEETTSGAMFTTIMWVIATLIFKFYLSYFARYDILYGNLSTMIILMVWVHFLSFIFVFGMAINVSRKEEQDLIMFQAKLDAEIEEKKKIKEEKKEAKQKTKSKKKKKSQTDKIVEEKKEE